jgi:hypothetical protein
MNDRFSNAPFLFQKTSIGDLNLKIHPKEYILLMLKFAPKDKVMGLWRELWDGVYDYDLLPAGCRTLMASVVNKIQQLELDEDWKNLDGIDLNFLTGLPRFVWAKNKMMQTQTIRIAEYVRNSGIEIVALKGTAELLSGEKSDIMRSTSDIDILIKLEDLELFKQKISELGYYEVKNNEGLIKMISSLQKDAYLFKSVNGFQLDIDVHVTVEKFSENNRITNLVWQNKVPSALGDNLFIPSTNERFLIYLINGFRFHNWYSGSYLKYLSDSLIYFELMDNESFLDLDNHQAEMADIRNWSNQIIELGLYLSSLDSKLFEKLKLRQLELKNNSVAVRNEIKAAPKNSLIKRIFGELSSNLQLSTLIYINIYKYYWNNSKLFVLKLMFYHLLKTTKLLGSFTFGFLTKYKSNDRSNSLVTPISNVFIR